MATEKDTLLHTYQTKKIKADLPSESSSGALYDNSKRK